MKILFIGDVFGEPGREAIFKLLPGLKAAHEPDLIIVNGENAAKGRGITVKIMKEFLQAGVHVVTSGNHIWYCQDIYKYFEDPTCVLLRPANLPRSAPGGGSLITTTAKGVKVGVINLMGKNFMHPQPDCPFAHVDRLLAEMKGSVDITVIDFHAEATAEKRAFGWHVANRVQAVVGTHTHVPTADEEILLGRCAYITDLGMTGPHDSVIGMKKESALKRFTTSLPTPFEVANGDVRLNGVIVEIDEGTKKAISIARICERVK